MRGAAGGLDMASQTLGMMAAIFLLTVTVDSYGKAWRDITPLKSTRADVERLFGESNELGRYEIENERAYIFYSEGPCSGRYLNLAKQNCECLVPKDTVLRIAVTLENAVNLSGIDKRGFSWARLHSSVLMSTYSNLDDGIVYTVGEFDAKITAIDYWPSRTDCEEIVGTHSATVQRNVFRGISPLHSTRADVERILGRPKRQSINQDYAYETDEERVAVLYSESRCERSVVGKWNVPADTVLRITLYPQRTVLIRDLNLDKLKYRRSPDPNIPNAFLWMNVEEGIIIESEVKDGCEQIVSLTYRPSNKDKGLLCK
jgi:hypothetical protein